MQVLRKAFNQQLDEAITIFVGSIDADQALIEVDITGSIAHAKMLAQVGILTTEQSERKQACSSHSNHGGLLSDPAIVQWYPPPSFL